MKKFLLVGVIVLLLLLGVAYLAVTFFMGGIVKSAVNQVGPKVTQSKVELASATLSPLSGTGTLSGFTVGNPVGWSAGNAFSLGTVRVSLEPKSLFADVIVINELVIDQPEFNYETHFVSSNISDLLKNIERYAGSKQEVAKQEGPEKKFIVKKLRFTNGKATLGLGVTALPVTLPEIKLDDIGVAEGGVTGSRLAVIVLSDVLKTVVNTATESRGLTGADSMEKTKEAAKILGDSVKELFKKKGP